MANARAVIATSVGGVVDLVGQPVEEREFKVCERGISIRPGDIEGFALGLVRLIADGQLRERIAENGFEFVRRQYPKQRLLDDIKGLYDELLNAELRTHPQITPMSDML
jgi:glycosyltransferase involved in cell wall biosynthesis